MEESLVLICVDCLRGDFRDLDSETPFLDEFFQRSRSFDNLFSTATTTTPCVASMMTGQYSEENGVMSLSKSKLKDDCVTLAEALSDEGYTTKAFVTGPLYPETGLNRGFDQYSMRDPGHDLFSGFEDELRGELSDLENQSFVYVHLWELHGPIDIPERFDAGEYGGTDYERALSALDRKLHKVIGGLPGDASVVVTGDHGESISFRDSFIQQNIKRARTLLRYYGGIDTRPVENIMNTAAANLFGTDYPDHFMEAGHGENVFDFTSNVPLAIRSPQTNATEIESQTRQIDIFPTVTELCGVEAPEVRGRSLLGRVDDRKAYVRACGESLKWEDNWAEAVRKDGWKLVTYPNRDWEDRLYHPEADDDELRPVKNDSKAEELRTRMPDFSMSSTQELEIKDKLRDLGYG